MAVLSSPLRSPIRSPIYSPTDGKWGFPSPPSGFVYIVENGVYLTRDGAYLIKAG